jgi:hypothetical protein
MTTNKIKTESIDMVYNQTETQFVMVPPVAGTFAINANPSDTFRLLGVDVVTNTGTLDIQVTIGGAAVTFTTDGTTVGVSSTVKSRTVASGGSVDIGDAVRLVVSNLASTPTQLEVCLHWQRI